MLAESFNSYSKNQVSFSEVTPKTSTENLHKDKNSTSLLSLDLDFAEDEFSINDLQSKAEENAKATLDAALLKIKSLEQELRNVEAEKTTYSDGLKESTEFRADLEASFNKLQVEFDQYKATSVASLISANEALQLDMERLAEKLMDEAERCSELEHSKQVLEAEIEDLSQKLFEEANKMVSDERRINKEWEVKHDNLQAKFNDLKILLDIEKEQSSELKTRIENLIFERDLTTKEFDVKGDPNAISHARFLSVSTISATRTSLSSDSGYKNSSHSTDFYTMGSSSFSFQTNDHRFQEFKEFLEASSDKGLYLTSKFMKRALNEDVDPALRFDSGPISGWMTQKRLLKAAQSGTINIISLKNNGISSRMPKACVFCIAKNECPIFYQYSITGTNNDPHTICYLCRNRLLAVCNFFSFLRMVRAGFVKDSLQKLYLGCLQARHSMFLSRIGINLAPFDEPIKASTDYDFLPAMV